MIDNVQDVDVAGKVLDDNQRREILGVKRKGKQQVKSALQKPTHNPTWKKIYGDRRLKFVLESDAVKTIVPEDAIPGMNVDKSKGGSFRAASGEVRTSALRNQTTIKKGKLL